MTLDDLRRLAAFHREAASNAAMAASLMGNSQSANDFSATSEQHDEWADKLTEFATAFETFRHPAITYPENQPNKAQ